MATAHRKDRIVPDVRAPVPENQGPGPAELQFQFSTAPLDDLEGKQPRDTGADEGRFAAWSALMEAAPELDGFFSPFVSAHGGPDSAMRTYGRFRPAQEGVSAGDLVRLVRGRGAGQWVLATSSSGRQVESAFVEDPETGQYVTWKAADLAGWTVEAAWEPTTSKVLAPESQIGSFWGVNLERYGAVQYLAPNTRSIDELLDDVFADTHFYTSSFDDLMAELEPELYSLDEGKLPIWPGSVLLTEKDGEIAVALPDAVIGTSAKNEYDGVVYYMDPATFGAQYVWYPHPWPRWAG